MARVKATSGAPNMDAVLHGMSLAMKPQRAPHRTAAGRDTYGRIMPGASLPGAAPQFTTNPAKSVVAKAPKMAVPAAPVMPKPSPNRAVTGMPMPPSLAAIPNAPRNAY